MQCNAGTIILSDHIRIKLSHGFFPNRNRRSNWWARRRECFYVFQFSVFKATSFKTRQDKKSRPEIFPKLSRISRAPIFCDCANCIYTCVIAWVGHAFCDAIRGKKGDWKFTKKLFFVDCVSMHNDRGFFKYIGYQPSKRNYKGPVTSANRNTTLPPKIKRVLMKKG